MSPLNLLRNLYHQLVPTDRRLQFRAFRQRIVRRRTIEPSHTSGTQFSAEIQSVKDKWSRDLAEAAAFSPEVYWLAIPEVIHRHQLKAMNGARYHDWIEYFVRTHLGNRVPVDHMASVGCGDGSLERRLHQLNAFMRCDAFDIAPRAIEVARQKAVAAGIDNVNYEIQDINFYQWEPNMYDAVWFSGSLHHIENLEYVCEQVAKSLKLDGFLFFNEYIGPSHFNFTERQREVMRAAFALIPLRFRKSFTSGYPHPYQQAVSMPDPADVRAVDPSESVRSAEIMDVVKQHFDIVEFNPMGGTILHFLLAGIAGNFRKEEPESIKVLEMLFQIEDALLEVGDIQSDFACVAAVPKRRRIVANGRD